MSVIRVGRPLNLWDETVVELEREKRRLAWDVSVSTDSEDYAPARHQPAVCDAVHFAVPGDYDVRNELNPAVSHPSCAGHCLSKGATRPHQPKRPVPPPDRVACNNRVFLEHYVWPYLLPLLEKLLVTAKKEGCFSRKKSAFNAMNFMAQELWNINPMHTDRGNVHLDDIPFVKRYWEENPRPTPPIVFTEDDVALQIQRLWRGYRVRRDPEVQELVVWQREWREINADEGRGIVAQISSFWERVMPDHNKCSSTSSTSLSASSSRRPSASPYCRPSFTSSLKPSKECLVCQCPCPSPCPCTKPDHNGAEDKDAASCHVEVP